MKNHNLLSVVSCLTAYSGFSTAPLGQRAVVREDMRKEPLEVGQDIELFPLVLPVHSTMSFSVYFENTMQQEQIHQVS